MAVVRTYAIIVIWLITISKVGATLNNDQAKVDGQWSRYGPWSACDKVCGHNGKQIKNVLSCSDPVNGGKDCVESQEIRSCNSTNCPQPCSFDGILIQLLNSIGLDNSVNNNHLVAAFSQVMEAMAGNAGSIPHASGPNNEIILKKIKKLLRSTKNSSRKVNFARKYLGLLLARQKTCDYTEICKELKGEIGNDGFKRLLNVDGKVTLTFAIDISGSMKSVIPQVTAIAKKIAQYNISNVDYILSTFYASGRKGKHLNGNVTNFENPERFIKAIEELAYRKFSRDDKSQCHEPAYAGIIQAITKGNPHRGSPMYVFTNAPPKSFREFTQDNVIYHAQRNKIPVNFFFFKPFCTPKMKWPYRVIAKATGGFTWTFRRRTSVKKIDRVVRSSLDGSAIVSSETNTVNGKQTSKRRIKIDDTGFYIDDIAREGTIEVEAKGIVPERIDLLNPNGNKNYPERVGIKSLSWTILKPMKGRWKFSAKDTNFQFGVKSQAKLDITLDWTFMRKETIIDYPLIGEKAQVKITIPNISRLMKKTLSLPDDWKLLSHDDNSFIYESVLPLTEKHFKIPIRGKTLSESDFTRESVIIQPKIAVIRSLMNPWFTPEPSKTFTYKASIDYAMNNPQTIQYKFGDDDGYKRITVLKGENLIFRNFNAPRAGHLKVKIKIKSDDVEINYQEVFQID